MFDYHTLNDTELFILTKNGDEDAFRELFLRYNSLLFLYAVKKLKDEDEAKDVVQEVFTTIWSKREYLTINQSLANYLYKIVLNNILNIFKHEAISRGYLEKQDLTLGQQPAESDSYTILREKELKQLITEEIEGMPPRMREIFKLKHERYLSTDEIANELNISSHTVSTQLKRARARLKDKFGFGILLMLFFN